MQKESNPAEPAGHRVRDPVSGFVYPEAWIQRCKDPLDLKSVAAGLAVLTSTGKVLSRGYSTGTTAAAAAKAAVLSLREAIGKVSVRTACGIVLDIPVEGREGLGTCRKDPGDHPADITGGLLICARAESVVSGIEVTYGEGIGRFSRKTPRYGKNAPAVSPGAARTIEESVREAAATAGAPGIRVSLWIPEGRKIAQQTLNERVGVCGGISLLGTTGFVEPWDDHLSESVLDRIGSEKPVVLTTGRLGLMYSRRIYPDLEVILVGSHIGDALARSPRGTVLCGLPGLILRYINPEICQGTGWETVEELMTDVSCEDRVTHSLDLFKVRYPGLVVVLLDRSGNIVREAL